MPSCLLVWMAFPPVNWWLLAWIAPCSWVFLIQKPTLAGRHPYGQVYLAGLVHWLLMTQWIRLPHWSAYFGWLALSLYLAVYLPVFVAASRVMVHRWRWPTMLAVPVVWTGLELARGHLLTGFSLALLGHSQVRWNTLIQLADVVGAYGIGFLVMMVAATAIQVFVQRHRTRSLLVLVTTGAFLSAALAYGYSARRNDSQTLRSSGGAAIAEQRGTPLRVALIQGSYDTQFDGDTERAYGAFLDYLRLSRQAVREDPAVQLVIWPESMFTENLPMASFDEPLIKPSHWDLTEAQFRNYVDRYRGLVREKMEAVARQLNVPVIVGWTWNHFHAGRVDQFNSAVHIGRDGHILGQYHKMHPVIFGEYVPLGNIFPWLYRLTPMEAGLTAGQTPGIFQVGRVCLSVSICFENTVPHLIRRQVRRLREEGGPPDALVTITNDGWFWGSSLLDLHLACGVFRAIEHRCPVLIAANTGLSAWIDSGGRIRESGARRAEQVVYATVPSLPADRAPTLYQRSGDVPAGICLFLATLTVVPACPSLILLTRTLWTGVFRGRRSRSGC